MRKRRREETYVCGHIPGRCAVDAEGGGAANSWLGR